MTDWGMYELEDLSWDEFIAASDSVVPHAAGRGLSGQGDVRKKQWHDKGTLIGDPSKDVTDDSFQRKGEDPLTLMTEKDKILPRCSWSDVSHEVFAASGEANCMTEVDTLNARDNLYDNGFKSNDIDKICTNELVLGNESSIGNNLRSFPLISSVDSDLELFENEWPDIGNFEDVDRMFRNCDSTFGQMNGYGESSLFLTPSHAIDSREMTSQLMLRSSSSESPTFENVSSSGIETKAMLDTDTPGIDSNAKGESEALKMSPKSSSFLDLDSESRIQSAFNGWIQENHENEGKDDTKVSHVSKNSSKGSLTMDLHSINVKQPKLSKSQNADGKRKHQSSEGLSSGCVSQPSRMHQFGIGKILPYSQQGLPTCIFSYGKHLSKPSSSGFLPTDFPHAYSECSDPPIQSSKSPTICSIKYEKEGCKSVFHHDGCDANDNQLLKKFPCVSQTPTCKEVDNIPSKINKRSQIQGNVTFHHGHSMLQTATPDQNLLCPNEDEADSEVKKISEESIVDADPTIGLEGLDISSGLTDNLSMEETSFQEFQQVIEQLDMKTKMCIRDSLYRLARSAEQRHNSYYPTSSNRVGGESSGVLKPERNRSTGYLDMETVTNPIDRSIAHLLFHRHPEPFARITDETTL